MNGTIFMFDLEGMQLKHAFKPSLASLRKLFKLVSAVCPFKIVAIHLLNTPAFINLLMGKTINFCIS